MAESIMISEASTVYSLGARLGCDLDSHAAALLVVQEAALRRLDFLPGHVLGRAPACTLLAEGLTVP